MNEHDSYDVHVVSHTHWDREWYQPFEQMRARLVGLIDRLLEALEASDSLKVFMLDGQTIVLEDYLEIRPENEARLRDLIIAKRILVGPWYVLSDEFLSSGEATIRNAIIGHDIASKFGHMMKVGYVPDTFGHVSQLPQILNGFGIDSAALFRGTGSEVEDTEVRWYAPDGSSVILINMLNSYGHLASLDSRPDMAAKKIKQEMSSLIPCGNSPCVLLMNGVDHQPAQTNIGTIVDSIQPYFQESSIKLSTLPDYIESLKVYAWRMKKFQGELRSHGRHILLPGVLSTRMYLKQQNYFCQIDMEKRVEPLSAISLIMGGKYDHGLVNKAWKYILSNQPHDSICGCSIDDVHSEMETRYRKATNLSDWLLRQSAYEIIGKAATTGKTSYSPVVVFNTSAARNADTIRIAFWTRDLECEHCEVIDERGNILPSRVASSKTMNWQYISLFKNITMEEEDGTVAPFQIMSQDELQKLIDEDKSVMFLVKKMEIDVLVSDVIGYGYSTLWVKAADVPARVDSNLNVSGNSIENEFYKVTVGNDGSLNVVDKSSGDVYSGCNTFADNADAGDTYNHSPVPGTKIIQSTDCDCSWRVIDDRPVNLSIEVTIDMHLPACLEADRKTRSSECVPSTIKTTATLYADIDRIDFETSYSNNAKDHRLRVCFPSNIAAESSNACGQFDVVSRKVKVSEEMLIQNGQLPASDTEAEVTTYPQEYFVDINDGRRGLAVMTKGLPEYEIIPENGIIALTLERSVDKISRDDLLTRRGPTAPALETPGAQCIRDFVFQYALIPHSGDHTSDHLLRQMQYYHNPLMTYQTDQHTGIYPSEMSIIEQSDPRIILSTIKKCERENALIIRMFNITDTGITTNIKINVPFTGISQTDMNEDNAEQLQAANGNAELYFRPKEIKTLKVDIFRSDRK